LTSTSNFGPLNFIKDNLKKRNASFFFRYILVYLFIYIFISKRNRFERWKLIHSYIHPVSYLLDPEERDISICDKDFFAGENEKWIDGIKDQWIYFRNKSGIYSFTDTNPFIFWQRLLNINNSKELAQIALKILGFPQSAASVERSFSTVRRIHTWQRNKIGRKKQFRI